jgi:uncharacterized protein YbaR (Trm112 family)
MNPAHLDILMCPKTKGSLRIATGEEIEAVNLRITRGELSIESLEAGLFFFFVTRAIYCIQSVTASPSC